MEFWFAAGGMAVVVGLLMIVTLRRGGAGQSAGASYDLQVYRDQLREVERDVSRGVLAEGEAGRLRAEVSRRVLDADRALGEAPKLVRAPKAAVWLAGGVIVLALAGSVALYDRIGAPGYGDVPIGQRLAEAAALHADRPSQAAAEARLPAFKPAPGVDGQFLDLMAKLRAKVAERPEDLQGHQLLAQYETKLGNYPAAWRAEAQVIALTGASAGAQDYAREAGLMIVAAQGYVSPEAEAALQAALRLDKTNGMARYYLGLMYGQTGRPDLAFRLWAPLLEASKPDDPWVPPIRAQIEAAAEAAGVNYTLPPAAGAVAGPSAGDVAAAAGMSAGDRQEMIKGMVAKLADQLGREGGTPAQWAQLIGAYGVLGEADKAREYWVKAQSVFAGHEADLAPVRAAAEKAGVAG